MKNIDDLYPTKIDNLKEHTIKEIYLKLLTNFKNITIEKNNLSDNLLSIRKNPYFIITFPSEFNLALYNNLSYTVKIHEYLSSGQDTFI